jgi:hypothetical protein
MPYKQQPKRSKTTTQAKPKPKAKSTPKASVKSAITIDTYKVISAAVAEGVRFGYVRAHKHTDAPSVAAIEDCLHEAIMSSLCDVIKFNDDDHDL